MHYKFKPVAAALFAAACNASFAQEQDATQEELPAVRIVSQHEERGMYSRDASIGRTDAPLREIPQTVNVLSRQAIEDIGASHLEEALDYVSGIHRSNNWGGLRDNFSIRGFGTDPNGNSNLIMRNGFASNRGNNARRDMANVERVEVIKGPASALYGTSEPGGIMNIVTKKPQFTPEYGLGMYVGSFDTYRLTADLTGPITDTLAWRLNLAGESSKGFRDYVHSRRMLIAPSLTWKPTANTTINYDSEILRHKVPMDRGIPVVNGHFGGVPRERFIGEPLQDGDMTTTNKTHQLTAEHAFSDKWKGKLGLSYRETSVEGYSSKARAAATPGTIRWARAEPYIELEHRLRDFSSDDLSLQGELRGKFSTGSIGHEILAGFDAYRYKSEQLMQRGRSANYRLNIYNPVYGQAQPTVSPAHHVWQKQHATGFFVQDQMHLSDNWRLLLGLRHDHFKTDTENRIANTFSTHKHSATTPRVGLTWLATPNLSLYALASHSFRPNVGADVNGQPFKPERGVAKEIGLKYESNDQRLGATLATYEIRKKNVLTTDPANTGYSVTAGEVRSRGVELDVSGQITDRIRLLGNYAYTDTTVTKNNNQPSLLGKELTNVAKHSGSLLAVHEAALQSAHYGVGIGITHVGKRSGNAVNSFWLPAYTTTKAMAYWKLNERMRFSLNIDNLFDKKYYASSYDAHWVVPGSPRTITLGMKFKF